MRIYISGKITGEPDYSEKFARAHVFLQGALPAAKIINPVWIGNPDWSWERNMRICIKALMDCDTIYILDNAKDSKGARLECLIAKELGMKMMYEGEA